MKKDKKEEKKFELICGERDENGMCETYINGVKSNIKLLVFSESQIETILEIQKNEKREKSL